MDNNDRFDTTATHHPLTKPDEELAAQITREVSWEERLEGSIYASGPGDLVQRLYSLEEVYNLLATVDNFRINFDHLADWVEQTLGDEELGTAVAAATMEDDPRERVTALLATRLEQVGVL